MKAAQLKQLIKEVISEVNTDTTLNQDIQGKTVTSLDWMGGDDACHINFEDGSSLSIKARGHGDIWLDMELRS